MPNQTQGRYWAIAAVVFFVALWYLGSVMLPFLVGGAVAYFLDPVADRLERLGLSRALATLVISVAAFVLVVLIVLALIPVLVQQLTSLINAAPTLVSEFQAFLITRFPELSDSTSVMRTTLDQIAQAIQARGATLAQGCNAVRILCRDGTLHHLRMTGRCLSRNINNVFNTDWHTMQGA